MGPTSTEHLHSSRLMSKITVVFLLFILALFHEAMAATPALWVEENIELTSYDGFSVGAVENLTGNQLDLDVTGAIEKHLKEYIRSAKLTAFTDIPSSKNVLIIKTHLALYQAGSALKRWAGLFGPEAATLCVLRVMLVDGNSGELVGDMVVVGNAGGIIFGGPGAEESILKDMAANTVEAIQKRIANE